MSDLFARDGGVWLQVYLFILKVHALECEHVNLVFEFSTGCPPPRPPLCAAVMLYCYVKQAFSDTIHPSAASAHIPRSCHFPETTIFSPCLLGVAKWTVQLNGLVGLFNLLVQPQLKAHALRVSVHRAVSKWRLI